LAKAAGNSNSSRPTANAPVVDSTQLDAAIVKEAGEPVPMTEAIADVLGDRGAFGDTPKLLIEPWFQIIDDGLAAREPLGAALFGRTTSDVRLDLIEPADPC
jgi:hypothetical protein